MSDYISRRRRIRASSTRILLFSKVVKFIFIGLILFIIFIFVLFVWYSRDLPTPGKLSASSFSQSTKIYDRNNIVLYDIYNQQNRTYVTISEIPKQLREATIAIEDKDFYTNQGFSVLGYMRVVRDLFLRKRLTGGSTLTQQLVKNTLLTSERSLQRKIKEFILAIQVERKYTKSQILELYLNIAPYGGSAVGVEAAAETYFGKKAKDLSLVESAILAGLPQLPSYYSPYGQNPKAYVDRTKAVLRRMREDKYITTVEEKDAVSKLNTVQFQTSRQSIKAPHFSFYIKDLLKNELQFDEAAIEQGGLRVMTTLDYKLQEKAEEIVKDEVNSARALRVGNGATVVIDPKNGNILAMVGSKDFFATESAKKGEEFQGQYNVITQARRQPGSAIKPVMYAAALEQGYSGASLFMDTPVVFPNPFGKDYEPKNYDGKYHGPVQMRFALGNSFNIPAVKLLAKIGVKSMLIKANNMGITTLEPTDENMKRFGLAITLGGGEVRPLDFAVSYSAFANGGKKVEPVAILKVTDAKGKVLYEYKDMAKKSVLSSEIAFIISHILLDNNARQMTFGENSYLNVKGKTIAVKTGTTDDKRDNWTIGWTPSILVATWVGNNDNSPMGNVASGATGASPIWRKVILEALKNKPLEDFAKPDDVVAVTIDAFGGGLPVEGKPTRTEYFIKGTDPQSPAQIYKQIRVSRADNNKLASDSEVEKNEYDVKKFVAFTESDPISTDGKNRWQEGIDTWVNEHYKDDPLYHAPRDKSDRTVSDTPTPTPVPQVTPSPTPSQSISPTISIL